MTESEPELRDGYVLGAVRYADHLRRSGRPDEAITVLSPVVRAAPAAGAAWLVLGLALEARNSLKPAATALREAVRHSPGGARHWSALGRVLATQGVRDEPVACFRRALACDPNHLDALVRLSMALLLKGDREAARPHLERALTIAPDHPGALSAWAQVMLQERRADEVYARLAPVLGASPPDVRLVAMASRAARLTGHAADVLPEVVRALDATTRRPDQIVLWHARAELCDTLGRVDEAFGAWRIANEIRGTTFDPDQHRRAIAHLIERTAKHRFAPLPEAFDERPVLIVGVPRSGSTLLEQALSRHPAVEARGELEALRDVALAVPAAGELDWVDALPRLDAALGGPLLQSYLSALIEPNGDATRYLDKMPSNLLHLGLLAAVAPGTRVIVMQRDPMASGFSCFRQPFGRGLGWATQLSHIGTWIREAHRLVEHWQAVLPLRFHTVDYDTLVTQPEPTLRGVLTFLDLPFDERVLAPEAATRTAGTVSQLEVLEPIHARSKARWLPYARHLGALRTALAPLARARPTTQAVAG